MAMDAQVMQNLEARFVGIESKLEMLGNNLTSVVLKIEAKIQEQNNNLAAEFGNQKGELKEIVDGARTEFGKLTSEQQRQGSELQALEGREQRRDGTQG